MWGSNWCGRWWTMCVSVCELRWLKARLLRESLDSQQGLALRLITTFCPGDTHKHTFSHTRTYLDWKTSRGSPIKPGSSLLYTEVWVPEGANSANNIPAEGCRVPAGLFRKLSNWHSQWTPGDQKKNECFHWSPSVYVCFVFVCVCVMSAWGEINTLLQISHNLILLNLHFMAVSAKTLSSQ